VEIKFVALKKSSIFAEIFKIIKKYMKTGDIAKVDPKLTGLNDWVEGIVIDIENNPFKGTVVAIKDTLNRIFYGEEKYFKICLQ